jgi:hypothetical protein
MNNRKCDTILCCMIPDFASFSSICMLEQVGFFCRCCVKPLWDVIIFVTVRAMWPSRHSELVSLISWLLLNKNETNGRHYFDIRHGRYCIPPETNLVSA